ncbi:colanic acid/amylovoran biosynthesis glycosyltransferase [Salinibacter ruber]|nr:colanic acid/amylovoran biosynthesis glycosyltransferase [Salinibacter ruber]MCS4185436.1 colanic acid/amylovoran biosynthesis glycosyltransferase [Salinibacter ruber]
MREIDPDVMHAHFGTNGAMVRPVAQRLGLPFVVTFYGADVSQKPSHPVWRSEYSKLWPVVDKVTVLSNEMGESVAQIGCPREKIEIVHLSRNLDEFTYQAPEGRVETFLTVGRLTEKKGHFDAIRAVKNVVKSHPAVRLRIVGDGPLRDSLETYIREQGLESHVRLLGAIPNREVAKEMDEADAFLLCSKEASGGDREGTPTVLVEAQAMGLPCVSTHHAGIPEMLPEENHHLLAPEGDVHAISDRMKGLMGNSEEQLQSIAEAGRAMVDREYNLQKEVSRLRELYSAVVEEPTQ